MRLPRFDLKRPKSLAEAAGMLREYGGSAALAAGGTDIFPRMKYRLSCPDVLVSLKGISATEPVVDSEARLHLDALTKLIDIVRSDAVQRHAPLLAEAAHAVGSAQIRNMATLGGNVCLETRCTYYNQSHEFQFVEPCIKRGGEDCYFLPGGNTCRAISMADTAPALICLDAQVSVVNGGEQQEQSVTDLFTNDSAVPIGLGPAEILSRITVPPQPARRGWAFLKLCPRGGLEFATVNVAVVLDVSEDKGICSGARIVVGSVAATPVRANEAEEMLTGEKLTEDLLRAAAETARGEVRPTPRPEYSRSYVRNCIETLCYDSLLVARDRMNANSQSKQ